VFRIKGKDGILHKLVYEVRYNNGFLYLDRCGLTAKRIMSTFPEWIVKSQDVSPQNAPLVSLANGAKFSFGALKYDLSMDQPMGREVALTENDVNGFITQADSVTRIVHEELELQEFTRVGFRMWYLFGGNSKEECEDWIDKLGIFKVEKSLTDAFSGNVQSQNHVVVLSGQDRNIRLAVNGVENLAQLDLGNEILSIQAHKLSQKQNAMLIKQNKVRQRLRVNPSFATMIDVDAFVEKPIDAVAGDYIQESFRQIQEGLSKAF
jgi:hypothetical protein